MSVRFTVYLHSLATILSRLVQYGAMKNIHHKSAYSEMSRLSSFVAFYRFCYNELDKGCVPTWIHLSHPKGLVCLRLFLSKVWNILLNLGRPEICQGRHPLEEGVQHQPWKSLTAEQTQSIPVRSHNSCNAAFMMLQFTQGIHTPKKNCCGCCSVGRVVGPLILSL